MGDATGGFLGVFEQRVHMLRKRLKGELEKDKPIRCRRTLKGIIREIKEWEKVLHEHIKDTKKCPHCGGKLE
jgi:hypothetical protein